MVLRFCIKLFSFVLNAQPNHYLLLKSASGCWEYFFFSPPCLKVKEGRNYRSFINALLHCGLNLQQMGQDTLANIQYEPADLHRASLFNTVMQGLEKALSVVVILKCDSSNFRGSELIPVLGREGDVHVGVCAHVAVPSCGCSGVAGF